MSVAVTVVAPRRCEPSNDDIAETSAPRVHDEHRNRGESEKAETGTARRDSAKVVAARISVLGGCEWALGQSSAEQLHTY